MRFVIDSNEFIFAFGPVKEEKARQFLRVLLSETRAHDVRIPRTIFEEVKRSLSHASDLPFKILSAEKCLTFIKRSLK